MLGRLRSWIRSLRCRRHNERLKKIERFVNLARAYVHDSKKAHGVHERVWYLIVFASKMVDLGTASWFRQYNPDLCVRKGSGERDVCIEYKNIILCGASTSHYSVYYHDQWIPSRVFCEEPWNGMIDEVLNVFIGTTEVMLSDLTVERDRLIQQIAEQVEKV